MELAYLQASTAAIACLEAPSDENSFVEASMLATLLKKYPIILNHVLRVGKKHFPGSSSVVLFLEAIFGSYSPKSAPLFIPVLELLEESLPEIFINDNVTTKTNQGILRWEMQLMLLHVILVMAKTGGHRLPDMQNTWFTQAVECTSSKGIQALGMEKEVSVDFPVPISYGVLLECCADLLEVQSDEDKTFLTNKKENVDEKLVLLLSSRCQLSSLIEAMKAKLADVKSTKSSLFIPHNCLSYLAIEEQTSIEALCRCRYADTHIYISNMIKNSNINSLKNFMQLISSAAENINCMKLIPSLGGNTRNISMSSIVHSSTSNIENPLSNQPLERLRQLCIELIGSFVKTYPFKEEAKADDVIVLQDLIIYCTNALYATETENPKIFSVLGSMLEVYRYRASKHSNWILMLRDISLRAKKTFKGFSWLVKEATVKSACLCGRNPFLSSSNVTDDIPAKPNELMNMLAEWNETDGESCIENLKSIVISVSTHVRGGNSNSKYEVNSMRYITDMMPNIEIISKVIYALVQERQFFASIDLLFSTLKVHPNNRQFLIQVLFTILKLESIGVGLNGFIRSLLSASHCIDKDVVQFVYEAAKLANYAKLTDSLKETLDNEIGIDEKCNDFFSLSHETLRLLRIPHDLICRELVKYDREALWESMRSLRAILEKRVFSVDCLPLGLTRADVALLLCRLVEAGAPGWAETRAAMASSPSYLLSAAGNNMNSTAGGDIFTPLRMDVCLNSVLCIPPRVTSTAIPDLFSIVNLLADAFLNISTHSEEGLHEHIHTYNALLSVISTYTSMLPWEPIAKRLKKAIFDYSLNPNVEAIDTVIVLTNLLRVWSERVDISSGFPSLMILLYSNCKSRRTEIDNVQLPLWLCSLLCLSNCNFSSIEFEIFFTEKEDRIKRSVDFIEKLHQTSHHCHIDKNTLTMSLAKATGAYIMGERGLIGSNRANWAEWYLSKFLHVMSDKNAKDYVKVDLKWLNFPKNKVLRKSFCLVLPCFSEWIISGAGEDISQIGPEYVFRDLRLYQFRMIELYTEIEYINDCTKLFKAWFGHLLSSNAKLISDDETSLAFLTLKLFREVMLKLGSQSLNNNLDVPWPLEVLSKSGVSLNKENLLNLLRILPVGTLCGVNVVRNCNVKNCMQKARNISSLVVSIINSGPIWRDDAIMSELILGLAAFYHAVSSCTSLQEEDSRRALLMLQDLFVGNILQYCILNLAPRMSIVNSLSATRAAFWHSASMFLEKCLDIYDTRLLMLFEASKEADGEQQKETRELEGRLFASEDKFVRTKKRRKYSLRVHEGSGRAAEAAILAEKD